MSHVCDRTQLAMSIYRELDPDARREVDTAVGECASCAAAWADEQLVMAHLAAIPDLAIPLGLRDRLHDIPDGSAPFVLDDTSVRLLLVLTAVVLWWFMLTTGQGGARFGDLDEGTPREAPAGEVVVSDAPDVRPPAPAMVERARPVVLVTPRTVSTVREDASIDAPDTFRAAQPPAGMIDGARPAGNRSSAPASRPGGEETSPIHANMPAEPEDEDGRGGLSTSGDAPGTGVDDDDVCVVVDIRPFFDSPTRAGGCDECGDGLADTNELESMRARFAALPPIRIAVDRVFTSGRIDVDREFAFPAGSASFSLELGCALFADSSVVLRAIEGDGGSTMCSATPGRFELAVARTPRRVMFAIPLADTCPVTSPTATTTPTPTTAPESTPTAESPPSPTAPTTPEPLDPEPATPSAMPSAVPTATYQPTPMPTSAWPEE